MQITKFITFEGGEGCGKSTQSKLLFQAIQQKNYPCYITREPGGTPGAEQIRNLLVEGEINKWEKMTEILLHMAARKEHVEKVIKPKLNEGINIICDRFVDSTIAYQGYGHELGSDIITNLHNNIFEEFYPDLTFIMDMDVNDGIKRTLRRKTTENRYEKMDIPFHKRVREGFLKIAYNNPERFIIINAKNTISHIHNIILEHINQRFTMELKPAS
jgi:dTMP kinase